MHIERIAFTPVKGGRHTEHRAVDLTATGPVGDRVFCLVDLARARVLRTVENPSLLQAATSWDAGVLTVDLAGRRASGVPEATGQLVTVDYWGRSVSLEVVEGPWAAAYSAHLDRPVVLARSTNPGEVVYGAPVSLVTTSSLRALETRIGHPVDSARFRMTFMVADDADTDADAHTKTDDTAGDGHVEDAWVGRELRVGDARVVVRGPVPRCAVVDSHPADGSRDAPVLGTLAGYRRDGGGINFGVDAVVSSAGRVAQGDPVSLIDDRVNAGRD